MKEAKRAVGEERDQEREKLQLKRDLHNACDFNI